MPEVPSTILGGLPVIADVSFGYDSGSAYAPAEHWADVDGIYWRKRDGSKGKRIPDHIYDRAEAYDDCFAELIERAQEHLIHESDIEREDRRDDAYFFS